MIVSVACALPLTAIRSLMSSETRVKPARTPRSRLKSSATITMRDSISTWRTGMSSVATIERIAVRFSAVSWTRSVLVRSSTVTLPRSESSEPPPADLTSRAISDALA